MTKMQLNLTDRFLADVMSLAEQPLSDSAIYNAKRCFLDYLGATFAGARMNENRSQPLAMMLGGDSQDASLIGLEVKSSLISAALVNGISSHTAELDDGVISGIIHPGTPTFSALIPIAQKYGLSGDRFLRGVVVGYEVALRLANAIQPDHKFKGYHATATCGAIGAAMGISIMRNFDFLKVKNAFSVAAVSAGGSLKVLEDNSQLKPYNPGHAAVSAIMACAVAEAGFIGPDDVLGGKAGFLSVMGSDIKESELLERRSNLLAVEQVYFKPYAACRYCHPAIETALKIKNQTTVDFSSIKEIRVSTYELAVTNHDHIIVESVPSAKMSIPFSVAVALKTGAASLAEYTPEIIGDSVVRDLMSKVVVRPDKKCTALFPQQTSAQLELLFRDGSMLSAEVFDAKGDPENPMSDDELIQKFNELTAYGGIQPERARRIQEGVFRLPEGLSNLIAEL